MRSRHQHRLIKLHFFQVLGHQASFWELSILAVDFDHEINKSLIFDCRNGSVLSDDLFAFDSGVEHNVVADGQAHGHLNVGELESEDEGVL